MVVIVTCLFHDFYHRIEKVPDGSPEQLHRRNHKICPDSPRQCILCIWPAIPSKRWCAICLTQQPFRAISNIAIIFMVSYQSQTATGAEGLACCVPSLRRLVRVMIVECVLCCWEQAEEEAVGPPSKAHVCPTVCIFSSRWLWINLTNCKYESGKRPTIWRFKQFISFI